MNDQLLLVLVGDGKSRRDIVRVLANAGFRPSEESGDAHSGDNNVSSAAATLETILTELPSTIPSSIVLIDEVTSQRTRYVRHPSGPQSTHPTLGEVEREHLIRILKLTNGIVKDTAKLLGIDRSTVYRKLKLYGIRPKYIRENNGR